ncbi:Zinc finger, RING/FYVE/PHD-type [Corchorus olitorius]|uniref:Zinc finger, RING/FYVE/PHD-type n=1 Tax=Corchorus olitorius TaxID=93759 RepID=A0A1R3GXS2_9ROSI|nr:Zinc finger, RING/FYVE/PHD-type [Corchorus olitorius]
MHVGVREIMFPTYVLYATSKSIQTALHYPHIIKTTRHHHRITHKYFLQSDQKEVDCQICFTQVKTEHGSYSCWKLKDCNFVAHVKCAMEEGLYDVIFDELNEEEEEGESCGDEKLGSMITSVIERNQDGEATKIQHSCHAQHVLTLLSTSSNNEEEEENALDLDDNIVTGACCPSPICQLLVLHFTLVVRVRLDVTSFSTRLVLNYLPKCIFGFIELLAPSIQRTCSIVNSVIAFAVVLIIRVISDGRGIAMVVVPHVILIEEHSDVLLECDQHLLTLAFHDKNEADLEQHYCDVCDEKRDPNLWFYHCAICDKSAHPICVLGKYPFFNKKKMIGSIFPDWFWSILSVL